MTHEDLIDIGFELKGIEDSDPFYKIYFSSPFKFGITSLSGSLEKGSFHLYGNDEIYTSKEELNKVISVFSGKN